MRENFKLTTPQQIGAGGLIVLAFTASFFLTTSLILPLLLILCVVGATIVRKPELAILGIISMEFIPILRGPRSEGNLSIADIAFGALTIAIILYWLVRLSLFEREEISAWLPHLLISLFFTLGIGMTAYEIATNMSCYDSFNSAIREILNLTPLLILPLLYRRFIEPNSISERRIFVFILIIGSFMIVFNLLRVRSSVMSAVYLYETGRGNIAETFSGLMVLIATSILISLKRSWRLFLVSLLLLLAWAAVFASFARALYVATIAGMGIVLLCAEYGERLRAAFRVALTFLFGFSLLLPVFFSVRLFRLLVENYALRLLSSQHIKSDLSLRMRYLEWSNEWEAVKRAPLFGHGFGSIFRFMSVFGYHMWQGFSHSSYMYLLFKTGFVGSLLFWSAYISFVALGVKLVRNQTLSLSSRIAVRAGLGYLVLILFYSYAAPVIDSKTDLIWIGVIWGLFLSLHQRARSVANAKLPKSHHTILAIS